MTFAGLKKWVPSTSRGRFVVAAISFTSRVEVLVARMAPGFAMRSSSAKTRFFSPISSNTASMMKSASASALKSVVPVMRPTRRSISSWLKPPRETVLA